MQLRKLINKLTPWRAKYLELCERVKKAEQETWIYKNQRDSFKQQLQELKADRESYWKLAQTYKDQRDQAYLQLSRGTTHVPGSKPNF